MTSPTREKCLSNIWHTHSQNIKCTSNESDTSDESLNNFNVVENSKKIVLIKNTENQSILHYNAHCVDYKKTLKN